MFSDGNDFENLDEDGNGFVQRSEFGLRLNKNNYELFEDADGDGDGQLNLAGRLLLNTNDILI